MARLTSALAIVLALLFAGCGSSGSESGGAEGVKSAYENLERQLINGDAVACENMTGDYKNKLAASVQMFEADCPGVVKEVQRGFREEPELRTTKLAGATVNGNRATLIAHSKYRGRDVRTRVYFVRGEDGSWLLDRDEELDEVAPSAPLAAYRAYTAAFSKGDGAAACALSTARGQELITRSVPRSHGGGDCAGAVPFLAPAARALPKADVVGGDEQPAEASLYTLQSNGSGTWVFRVVVMKNEGGKWLFDFSRDLGTAPPRSIERGPVA
ncbi:MAG: hypothetical protein JHC98_11290 [Thermoleophilaceae bacterium]|nr:hypothetical protein [Thermoleophilaceae bacterium]